MMNNNTDALTPDQTPRPISSRVAELEQTIAERDEKLRSLNRALAEALAELEMSATKAA